MSALTLTVPLVAPTVNHYVKHTRAGRHYVTPAAKAFKDALALVACDAMARTDAQKWLDRDVKWYHAEVTVFQGKGDKGDVDNYAKCVLDGLVAAGVIHSDAAITDLIMRKRRDRDNPRTEITVRPA